MTDGRRPPEISRTTTAGVVVGSSPRQKASAGPDVFREQTVVLELLHVPGSGWKVGISAAALKAVLGEDDARELELDSRHTISSKMAHVHHAPGGKAHAARSRKLPVDLTF